MQQIFLNGILCYWKQLPSETNTLPSSALSPLTFELAPTPSSHGCSLYPKIQDSQRLHTMRPSAYAPPANGSLPTTQIAFITTRRSAIGYDRSPLLFSLPRRSLAPGKPTTCLIPTHRTRQRISQHSPSPTSHDTSTSRGETICLSPFLSTRGPADATTRPCLELQTYSKVVWPHCASRAPETIGLLSRGAHSPAIYAPRNAS
jgi:hypothetical protein